MEANRRSRYRQRSIPSVAWRSTPACGVHSVLSVVSAELSRTFSRGAHAFVVADVRSADKGVMCTEHTLMLRPFLES
jgi:hypothetical protein